MTSYPPPGEQSNPGQYPPPQPGAGYPPATGSTYPPDAGTSYPPASGSAYPPAAQYGAPVPPVAPYGPPASPVVTTPGPIAWLIPVGALLAVIGVFTPWFKPKVSATVSGLHRSASFDNLYSWKDGRVGILAPVLLVIVAIGVVGLLRGRVPARFNKGNRHPISSAGLASIGAAVLSFIFLVIAWFMLPGQLEIKGETGDVKGFSKIKDQLQTVGAKDITLSHGAQLGFWLTLVGALLVLVTGVLLFLEGKKKSTSA